MKTFNCYKISPVTASWFHELASSNPSKPMLPSMSSGLGFCRAEIGYFPPPGEQANPLAWVSSSRGAICIQKRHIHASTIKYEVAVKVKQWTEQTGFAPGPKTVREFKEQVIAELTPRALIGYKEIPIAVQDGLLFIGSASEPVRQKVIEFLLACDRQLAGVTINGHPYTPCLTIGLVEFNGKPLTRQIMQQRFRRWLDYNPNQLYMIGQSDPRPLGMSISEVSQSSVRFKPSENLSDFVFKSLDNLSIVKAFI